MDQIIYKLVMLKGPSVGEEFILDRPEIVIGRDIKNEVVVNDTEVSRYHTRLTFKDESFVVQDMGSTNGTFIDETRISGLMPLEDGVQIRMGDNVVLQYVVEMPNFERTAPSLGIDAPAPAPQATRPAQQPAPQQAPPSPAPAAPAPRPDTPPPQPVQQSQPPPVAAPIAEPPGYTGQVPDSPPSQQLELPFDTRMLGLGCGGILIVIAIILIFILMYVDNNMLWCDWLGWIIPNRCPIG